VIATVVSLLIGKNSQVTAFGRFLPVAAGVLVASYVAIAHAAR
jgi:hypothetical protein